MAAFPQNRRMRMLLFTLLPALTLALILLAAHTFLPPLLLWWMPSLDLPIFNLGLLGAYRTNTYISFPLASPRLSRVTQTSDSCSQGYIFLDPFGPSVAHSGPLIIDAGGELVWTSDEYRVTTNSKVQTYRGEDYLTFWSGEKAKTSGVGSYYMLRNDYSAAFKIDAVGEGMHGDLHEFRITTDDTALMTVYTPTHLPDAAFGYAWITDNYFQEMDIETGELLFQWKASDHFHPQDSYMSDPFGGYSSRIPFDFFHLNSIAKDSRGNYLISSRHFHALYYINGTTGDVIWGLGGSSTDFEDLSDGDASSFSWQHDARWLSEDQGIISLFDNSYAWPHSNAAHSTVRTIQIDEAKRTATLLHALPSAQEIRSSSQGAVQHLPSKDSYNNDSTLFVGWGSSAAFSEYTMNGELLCETNFASPSLFWWERVKSYRAFKTWTWNATPADWNPNVKVDKDRLYVSWNGATEVAFWQLEGCDGVPDSDAVQWEVLDVVDKTGFEDSFSLPPRQSAYTHVRAAALDREKTLLRHSNSVSTGMVVLGRTFGVLVGVLLVVGLVVVVGGLWVLRRRGWRGQDLGGLWETRIKYTKLR